MLANIRSQQHMSQQLRSQQHNYIEVKALSSRQHLHKMTSIQHKLRGGVETATNCSVIAVA